MEQNTKTQNPGILKMMRKLQKGEQAGYEIYTRLAMREKNRKNREVLNRIAAEELAHYTLFKSYTQENVKANRFYIWLMLFLARVFGLVFGLKLMERVEAATEDYEFVAVEIPKIREVIDDEEEHEQQLINMIDEEKLSYLGSVVLGLNDALVELTGALAGFTLSIQDSRTIAMMGLITGISASFSMAASEYLSTRSREEDDVDPKRASLYTGMAYVVTVIFLVLPFLFVQQYMLALTITLGVAIAIIAFFNYYLAVAKDEDFKSRFGEMAVISIGVAAISFLIGYLVRAFFGLDI